MDFYGAVAGIAGTLWAITITMFQFASAWAVRSPHMSGPAKQMVLGNGFIVIATVSSLFLAAMLVSLGEMAPEGARLGARIALCSVVFISQFAPVALLIHPADIRENIKQVSKGHFFWAWRGIQLSAFIINFLLSMLHSAVFFLAIVLVSNCLQQGREIGADFWVDVSSEFSHEILEKYMKLVVLVHLATGCMVCLITGIASTLAALSHQEPSLNTDPAPLSNQPPQITDGNADQG
jgi:hypothetical protein